MLLNERCKTNVKLVLLEVCRTNGSTALTTATYPIAKVQAKALAILMDYHTPFIWPGTISSKGRSAKPPLASDGFGGSAPPRRPGATRVSD